MSSRFAFVLVHAPLNQVENALASVTTEFAAVRMDDAMTGVYLAEPTWGIESEKFMKVAAELSQVFTAAMFGAWNDQIGVEQGHLFRNGQLSKSFGFPLDRRGYPIDDGSDAQDTLMKAVDEFAPAKNLTFDDLFELFGFKVYGLD